MTEEDISYIERELEIKLPVPAESQGPTRRSAGSQQDGRLHLETSSTNDLAQLLDCGSPRDLPNRDRTDRN